MKQMRRTTASLLTGAVVVALVGACAGARPALATVAVFQFVWAWTDFLRPLIYLNDSSQYTLSIGLYSFFSEHGVDWGPLMAASVIFTIPVLVVFLLGQRYFVEGVATTGLK